VWTQCTPGGRGGGLTALDVSVAISWLVVRQSANHNWLLGSIVLNDLCVELGRGEEGWGGGEEPQTNKQTISYIICLVLLATSSHLRPTPNFNFKGKDISCRITCRVIRGCCGDSNSVTCVWRIYYYHPRHVHSHCQIGRAINLSSFFSIILLR